MKDSEIEFAALVGIDWADKKHDTCLFEPGSGQYESSVIEHRTEAIDEWATGLLARFGGRKIAIAYEHLVIYPLNPAMVAKYRGAFATSGSKSDIVDARLQAEILQVHRHKLTPLKVQSPVVRQLTQLVHFRRKLVQDRVNLSNRIIGILKQYYPQPLELFHEKDTLIFCDFLMRWPTLKQAQEARKKTLIEFFKEGTIPVTRPLMKSEWNN